MVGVALLATASAPAHADTPGRGTASVSLHGVSVSLGDVSVDLIEASSRATRDSARHSLERDHARGELRIARAGLAGHQVFVPASPFTVHADGRDAGPSRSSYGSLAFDIPDGGAATPADADGVVQIVNALAGASAPTLAKGLVASGASRPVDLEASFGATGARVQGASEVDRVDALAGLVGVRSASLAEQSAWSDGETTGATARALSVESITVLDTGALLRLLGVDLDGLSLATLAALADGLGLPVEGTLDGTPLSGFGSWSDVSTSLNQAADTLDAAVDSAAPCGLLPSATTSVLSTLGLTCSGTVTAVQGVLTDVTDRLRDATGVVSALVDGAPLLSVSDLGVSVHAVAAVSEKGEALTSAQASGSVGQVTVGRHQLGGLSLESGEAAWDLLRDATNGRLDSVLEVLGPAYAGLVTLDAVPRFVQTTGVNGNYAQARAEASLFSVTVTLPSTLPDPADLTAAIPPAPALTPTTVTVPPTTVPTLPLPLPLPTTTITLPPLTLPIAFVRPAPSAPQVAGEVVPVAASLTVDVGVLSAEAEHTRPGIDITGGGENRTWSPARGERDRGGESGFGPPGSLPRTGLDSGAWPIAFAAVLVACSALLSRVARRGLPGEGTPPV
jgi:hypothetical protein